MPKDTHSEIRSIILLYHVGFFFKIVFVCVLGRYSCAAPRRWVLYPLKLELTDGSELTCVCWEFITKVLCQERLGLLTTEPPL